MKRALITSITGQDGSFLAELLLEKEYTVYGLARRKSRLCYGNVEHLADINGVGVTRLQEVIRQAKPEMRFYQASTSKMHGKVQEIPQTKETFFYPCSPTAWPSNAVIGSPGTTGRAMACMPARHFFDLLEVRLASPRRTTCSRWKDCCRMCGYCFALWRMIPPSGPNASSADSRVDARSCSHKNIKDEGQV